MKMKNLIASPWLIAVGALLPIVLHAQTSIGAWTQSSPAVNVSVDTNGTFLSTAPLNYSLTFNSAETASTSSAPQFLWVAGFGALRAGSFASAPSSTTMGPYSAAFGIGMASGWTSFSAVSGTASGSNAVSLGTTTTASGMMSFASGYGSLASGSYSTAMGDSTASASYAVALGNGATATAGSSVAIGTFLVASGVESMATGYETKATGTASLSTGELTTASGTYSASLNFETTAGAYAETTLGQYNLNQAEGGATPSSTTWVSTAGTADPLLEVGNGTSSAKSDALVLYKDGNAVFAPPAGTPAPPAGTPSCTVSAPAFITTAPGGSGDIPMFTGN